MNEREEHFCEKLIERGWERYRYLRAYGDAGCTEKDGYGGSQLLTGQRLDDVIDKQLEEGL